MFTSCCVASAKVFFDVSFHPSSNCCKGRRQSASDGSGFARRKRRCCLTKAWYSESALDIKYLNAFFAFFWAAFGSRAAILSSTSVFAQSRRSMAECTRYPCTGRWYGPQSMSRGRNAATMGAVRPCSRRGTSRTVGTEAGPSFSHQRHGAKMVRPPDVCPPLSGAVNLCCNIANKFPRTLLCSSFPS